MTGTSPPGPLRCGSTTCSVKAVAAPASKALPPHSKIPMPTAVAIQWVVVTTPNVPSISGRVVKVFGLTLVMKCLLSAMRHGVPDCCAAPGRRIETECTGLSGDLPGQGNTTCESLLRLG